MQTIILKPLQHNGTECIGIYFEKNALLQSLIQKQAGARWSRTHKCWHLLLSKSNYDKLAKELKGKVHFITDELKNYLLEKKKETPFSVIQTKPAASVRVGKIPVKKIVPRQQSQSVYQISKENKAALEKFKQQLILKSYSPSTIRTYTNEFVQFLNTIKEKPATQFTTARIKDYMQYCSEKLKLSENTLHSKINALKFYYEQVLGRDKFFWEIPRPKKHLILPKVLGEEELRRLFEAANNLKHKAILFTAYGAGLRVSEVINLRMQDIDRERKQLFVYCSKGKKDRYVALSPLLLDLLENYYKIWKPKPVNYLFEGEEQGKPYSVRSAQIIFHNAKLKAGISKTISFHGLRHSFATHMLEKGVDVKFIKEILGHFNIKTTERYLHVKRETLINIESPLDALYRKT
jgi:integrase/recombinase XerD